MDTKSRPWSSPANSRNFIFYKLIVPSIIHDKILRIPDKLVKEIRNELSSVATLSVPDGRVWCVELKKIDHKIWFDTCWQEFMEHYSIQEGHFLIFTYEGDSNFSIHIFDLTNSEINYMSKTLGYSEDLSLGKQCAFPHKEELIYDDSINISDLNPCSSPSSLKCNGVERHAPSMESNRPSLRDLIKAYDESFFGFNKENRNAASFYGNGTNKDNQHLIKDSQISQPPKPLVLNVSLKETYVKPPNTIYTVPGDCLHLATNKEDVLPRFAQDNVTQCSEDKLQKSCENVKLHIQDEEILLPRFSGDIIKQIGLQHKHNQGERRFQASNLQTKRIEPCEYEPPAKRIKANSILSTWRRAVTTQEKQKAIDAANNFLSSNPFCKVVLKPFCVYRGFLLHMPRAFCKEYMNEISGMIRLQDCDGKQWAVRYLKYVSGFMLSKGWAEFMKDHNLEEGDVCIFELIQVKQAVLKVTIFRVIENTGLPTQSTVSVEVQRKFAARRRSRFCEHEPLAKCINEKEMNGLKENFDVSTNTRALILQKKRSATDTAKNFKSNNPYCMVVMKPSFVSTRFLLHLPFFFCEKYLNEVSEMIKLQDSEGKQWPVRYLIYGEQAKLSKGWFEFVMGNNLEEGDVCIFELIQTKDTVLRVTIFPVLKDTTPPIQPVNQNPVDPNSSKANVC